MSIQLHRRIKRIEAEVTGPYRTGSIIVLQAPAEASHADAWARHKHELAEARKRHSKVIVISDQHTQRQEAGRGLVYVPNRFEATLAVAASQPSECGNRSQLDDILDGLCGNVLGPHTKIANFQEWAVH